MRLLRDRDDLICLLEIWKHHKLSLEDRGSSGEYRQPSMSAVFCGPALASTESATTGQSATSQCLFLSFFLPIVHVCMYVYTKSYKKPENGLCSPCIHQCSCNICDTIERCMNMVDSHGTRP